MPPQRNRHPSLLSAERTLLLVVDMQETFLRPIWEREHATENVRLLMGAARILEVPILATVQYAEKMGGPIAEIAELLPEACEPIDKLCFSCLGAEEVSIAIRRSGRNQVLLCGIETHICVCQTALDLVSAGYHTHVAADAVSSRSERTWELGLRKMEQARVTIDSTEGAIYEMMYQAGTPQFREVLKLVRVRD
jgi:nicotinamidase-related amidase